MNIGFNPVKFNPIQKTQVTNDTKVNFKGGVDSVEFSADAKEKAQIIKNLINIDYTPRRASEMVNDYYKSDKPVAAESGDSKVSYDELVNGDEDGEPLHFVEITDRNLTPTEAVVYMAEGMHDYYSQHYNALEDWDYYEYGAKSNAEFTPLELAECMNEGLDIITAGMVLKGAMDLNTAKRVSEYFAPVSLDCIDEDLDLYDKERICDDMKERIDEIELYASDEKNPDGTLKSGLIRPLSKEEIVKFMYNIELPWDIQSLNNYLLSNK